MYKQINIDVSVSSGQIYGLFEMIGKTLIISFVIKYRVFYMVSVENERDNNLFHSPGYVFKTTPISGRKFYLVR